MHRSRNMMPCTYSAHHTNVTYPSFSAKFPTHHGVIVSLHIAMSYQTQNTQFIDNLKVIHPRCVCKLMGLLLVNKHNGFNRVGVVLC